MEEHLVLFDGDCYLCSKVVQFIVARDPGRQFVFAPLQSKLGRPYAEQRGTDSFLLVTEGRVYDQSRAALEVVRRLRGGWKLLYALRIIPAPLRDALYRFVARNRHRWFAGKDVCVLPTEEWRQRWRGDEM